MTRRVNTWVITKYIEKNDLEVIDSDAILRPTPDAVKAQNEAKAGNTFIAKTMKNTASRR